MADPVIPTANPESPQAVYKIFCAHNSGLRIHTDTTIQTALLSCYPSHALVSTSCDLISFAQESRAIATLTEDVHPALRSWTFEPTARQPLDGSTPGKLKQEILFGRYDYVWQDLKFQVFVVDGQNSPITQCDRRYYVLHQPIQAGERNQAVEAIEALIIAASVWSQQSDRQIWVYDQGRWSKNEELWRMVQDASWEDVILEESTKRAIMRDAMGFFDTRATYLELGAQWKRGLIFHGSPGNGKTSTAKALMKALMARAKPIPTLIVKTLAQRGFGPQMSVRQIFTKARQTAPCLLLFEDIDSLVTDEVRSYFFNEVDGLEDNEGILMIASTNNLDKLDAGLSKRPSRFDRKYRFENPSREDRVRYCERWSKKLPSRFAADIPYDLPDRFASITEGFSFAYMKEAFVASLLTIVRGLAEETPPEWEEEDDQWGRFGSVLQRQVIALRKDIAG